MNATSDALGVRSVHAGRRTLRALTALGFALAAATSPAQTGGKPLRIVVPYPAGGSADVMTRIVANRMSANLAQPVIVENRPGANANIGAEAVAGAAPDGQTLLASANFLVINPLHQSDLRWQPGDFLPVARLAQMQNLVVVPSSTKVSTLAELVARAKASPGLPAGTAGTGNTQTNAILMFEARAGIKFNHIYYKGGPPAVPDLMNGTLEMSVLPYSLALPGLKDGRLRALATLGDQRSALLPDVPTSAEAGYPQVLAVSWYGLHAPKGTPREAVGRIEAAAVAALKVDAVREQLLKVGGEPAAQDSAAFAGFLGEETRMWSNFLRSARAGAGK
jgi:tripartite-type tricarboxylate transporter receptor subunit TctC